MPFLSMQAGAAEVQIIGFEIPGLHQQDKQGAYDQILHQVAINDKLATLNIYPPARAERSFENCNNCCITPVNSDSEFYDYDETLMQTEPLNTARIYIFSPPGVQPYTSLEQLKDKVIGTRFAMPYGKRFNQLGLKKIEVSDLQEHISLMKLGHIDAFLAYAPDIYHMFNTQNIKPYPHDKAQPYAVHDDALVCRGVSEDFIRNFNARVTSLRQLGKLQAILGDRYLPPKMP